MAAGGVDYNGLRTSRKVTLPSVESWGTNMNIVKDPSKGVYTRRKERVGETQEVLLAQENSGDRISECINVYARGVNPMVSVSYDNYGNNGGSSLNSSFRKQSVKLPYKPEVFIPPILRQEDLLPLSRLPRNWMYAFSNPQMPDIIQETSCTTEKKCIETRNPQYSVESNKQYIKELPENFDKSNIKVKEDTLDINIDGIKSESYRGDFHGKIEVDNSKINHNRKLVESFTNKVGNYKKYNIPSTEIQRNIRENPHKVVFTNKNQLKNTELLTHVDYNNSPNGIEENRLRLAPIEANKSDRSSLKYTSDFDNSPLQIRDNLPVDIDIKKGSLYHTIDKNIYDNNPFQSQKDHPYVNVTTIKNGGELEKLGNIERYTEKNINRNPLNYTWRTNKKINQQKIMLDPSNIPMKRNVCIPVDSSKSNNIYKNISSNDISTIKNKRSS